MSETELEKLIPSGIEVNAGGETLTITPIKVKELTAFTRSIAPMVDTFTADDKGRLIQDLMMNHTDSFIEAVAIGARKPTEWINELELDELANLAAAVIEVNADFFMRRVLPTVSGGMIRLNEKLSHGQKPT